MHGARIIGCAPGHWYFISTPTRVRIFFTLKPNLREECSGQHANRRPSRPSSCAKRRVSARLRARASEAQHSASGPDAVAGVECSFLSSDRSCRADALAEARRARELASCSRNATRGAACARQGDRSNHVRPLGSGRPSSISFTASCPDPVSGQCAMDLAQPVRANCPFTNVMWKHLMTSRAASNVSAAPLR